jgi:site-specific DNA recombinase
MNIIGYCRVSTDEQAEKGFSLANQEEEIKRYCKDHGYKVLKIFKEDHSGFKTFNRPAWNHLEKYINENNKTEKVHAVISTRWDRFSRNEFEASSKINEFRKKGVEIRMIDSYYSREDLSGPMLNSIHMHLAEMESRKNSIRTKEGMRRGLKEGFWMYKPPFGYVISKEQYNKPILIPVPEKAKVVQVIFEEMSTGLYSAGSLRKKYYKELNKMSKQNFLYMLRRHVYTGKIEVKATDTQKRELVQGLHEAIISQELFQKVQDILDGKKPNIKKVNNQAEIYPLKNFLKCQDHQRTFTASGSRGRNGIHHYYHCTCSKCKNRFPVEKMHDFIYQNLKQLTFSEEILELAKRIYDDFAKSQGSDAKIRISKLKKELESINNKKNRVQDDYMNGDINSKMMNDLLEKLEIKEKETEAEIHQLKNDNSPINELVSKSQSILSDLAEIFKDCDGEDKQLICGSMFSEKIEFSNKEVRTVPWKSFVEKIVLINKELEDLVTKKADKNVGLPTLAPPLGLEPRTP